MAGSVITVGTFDGVHLGHRRVLEKIARRARRAGRGSVLLTFEPHPLSIVNPPAAPRLLTLGNERREMLAQCEVDVAVFFPFTRELSHYSPAQFIDLLKERFQLEELVVGYDHGFGSGRSGNATVLRKLGKSLGFAVDVVKPVSVEGRTVSSALIRRAVAGGNLKTAAQLLGRPYSLTAPVVHGAGRGDRIGYPTINLELPDPRKLLPPDGVYAVKVEWRFGTAGGMMHIGPRPTFGESNRSLEVHLLDVDVDLYDTEVKVSWLAKLRDVMTFTSPDALRAQLERDREAASAALTGSGVAASH